MALISPLRNAGGQLDLDGFDFRNSLGLAGADLTRAVLKVSEVHAA